MRTVVAHQDLCAHFGLVLGLLPAGRHAQRGDSPGLVSEVLRRQHHDLIPRRGVGLLNRPDRRDFCFRLVHLAGQDELAAPAGDADIEDPQMAVSGELVLHILDGAFRAGLGVGQFPSLRSRFGVGLLRPAICVGAPGERQGGCD